MSRSPYAGAPKIASSDRESGPVDYLRLGRSSVATRQLRSFGCSPGAEAADWRVPPSHQRRLTLPDSGYMNVVSMIMLIDAAAATRWTAK